MPRTKLRLLALIFVAALPSVVKAQSTKTPVQVVHSGKDNVGQRLAFELREVIRGSRSMKFVSGPESDPRIVVQLVTQDNNSSSPGNAASVAMAIIYDGKFVEGNGIFLTMIVQNCGSKVTQDCARDLAADIDQEIEKLKTNWPSLARQLK